MPTLPTRTAIILPMREGFSELTAGAVALWVHESICSTRKFPPLSIFGRRVENPFLESLFHPIDIRGRFWQRKRVRYLRAITKALLELQPEVIEIHNRPIFLPYFQKWLQSPHYSPHFTLFFHNDPQQIEYAKTSAERTNLTHQCRSIYCVSDFIKSRFLEGIEQPGNCSIHTVPNGIDLPLFHAGETAKENLILYVGRIVPEKGVSTFLEAIEELLPKASSWKALLVGSARHGGGSQGKFEKLVQARIHTINQKAEGRVEWKTFMPFKNVTELYKRAAIAVVPSEWQEPFGRTAIEAMAARCALVTTGQGGLQEIADNVAPLFPAGDAKALEAILSRLITEPDYCSKVQRQCLQRASSFDLTELQKRIATLRNTL